VRYYFVEDPDTFDREQLYGVSERIIRTTPDGSRSSAARPSSLQARLDARCDHCHDWQSALVRCCAHAVRKDATVEGLAVIFTIHNMVITARFRRETMKKIGLPRICSR